MVTVLIFAISQFLASSSHADPNCLRQPGSRPDPVHMPINHIIVIMQENHSFDNYFGRLNQPQYYGDAIDGVTPRMRGITRDKKYIYARHTANVCLPDVSHDWNAMHRGYNGGKNDGFTLSNPRHVMDHFSDGELPFYYALANQFAVADRYFASVMTQTFPNRHYLFAGTSFGQVMNQSPESDGEWNVKTVFDELDANGISWKYYYTYENYLRDFRPLYNRSKSKMGTMEDYKNDLARGALPSVVFVESSGANKEDEHPASDIRIGQAWVADKIKALMNSAYWKDSVLFFVYDEGGGFFDHVPPPMACAADNIKPRLRSFHLPGTFEQYGYRVPFVVVSPYAKHHYVSHVTYDHTSILKFIETRFNLPALTKRDANADGLLDLFDFDRPVFEIRRLPETGTTKWVKSLKCKIPKVEAHSEN